MLSRFKRNRLPFVPHLILEGGKQGNLFLLNRDNMGKFNSSKNNVVQTINVGSGIFSTPAFWQNNVYLSARNSGLLQFVLNPTTGTLGGVNSRSTTTFNFPGATPSISS